MTGRGRDSSSYGRIRRSRLLAGAHLERDSLHADVEVLRLETRSFGPDGQGAIVFLDTTVRRPRGRVAARLPQTHAMEQWLVRCSTDFAE